MMTVSFHVFKKRVIEEAFIYSNASFQPFQIQDNVNSVSAVPLGAK